MTMIKPTRRRLFLLGSVAVILSSLYFIGPALLAPVIQRRLVATVASHLNAELKIGGLRYHFPYGITLTDASLTTTGASGESTEFFKVRGIELRLAELPIHRRPLIIERLILTEPAYHMIKTEGGVVGGEGLLKTASTTRPIDDDAPLPPLKVKLSELFRLQRFALENGRIIYEDRTRPETKPMVWTGLKLDVNTTQQSAAVYTYSLRADNLPVAQMAATGTINLDDLSLDAKDFSFKVQVSEQARASKLPGPIEEILLANHIQGTLVLSGHAAVPLRRPLRTAFDATLDLPGISARMPQWETSLDRLVMRLRISTMPLGNEPPADPLAAAGAQPATDVTAAPMVLAEGRRGPVWVQIQTFDAGTGDTRMMINKGVAQVNPVAGTWRVRDLLGTLTIGENHESLPLALQRLLDQIHGHGKLEFTATAAGLLKPPPGVRAADSITYELAAFPRGFSFQPRNFPLPIERLSGTIHLKPGLVRLENMEGRYGEDKLFVAGMRLPLEGISREIRIEEINGSIDFSGKSQHYPRPLEQIFAAIHPGGMYTVAGRWLVRPKEPRTSEYALDISSDHGTLAPTDRWIPISDVICDVAARTGTVDISRFQANLLDGKVVGTAHFKTGPSITYEGHAETSGVDLRKLGQAWTLTGEAPTKMSGKGYAEMDFSGTGASDGRTPLDNFRANGEFELLEGDFWEVPVIKDLIGGVKVAKEALTAGQAAGDYQIYDRKVDLKNAALSGAVIGLQGGGIVGFDGRLDLRVVAAPLADWKDKLKQTKIPIISDAIGELAGGLQKLVNTATSNLLYEFHVTGMIAKPVIITVPAPILSEGAAKIFGKMLNPGKDERLIDAVRPRNRTPK